jgi:hypothetical protein
MYWATVMCFRKTTTSQYIFDAMTMIRQNWQHYRDLYHISETAYRNDYALSIALGIVNGQPDKINSIPWSMASVVPENKLSLTNDIFWDIEYADAQGKLKTVSVVGMDFHAMGKRDLGAIIETHRRARLCDHGHQH